LKRFPLSLCFVSSRQSAYLHQWISSSTISPKWSLRAWLCKPRFSISIRHPSLIISSSIRRLGKRAASWCLTDGEKWIFGVTWKHEGGGYRYDTITIDELTDKGRVPKDLESRSELILKTVACWVSTDIGEILRSIRTERRLI
jgi:hypothetical protein